MPRVHAGDLDVFYLEKGAGDPLLLLHGNWGTSSWWEPTLERLPSGMRALAPDLRGDGGTRGGSADHSIGAYAADAIAFADALGLERFTLVGHSFGASIAIDVALTYPDRLRALVAVCPGWIDGMPDAYAVSDPGQLKDIAVLEAALRAICPAAPRGPFWERLVLEGHAQDLAAAKGRIPAQIDWRPGDRVGEIRVPRVVITGARDPLVGAIAPRVAQAMGCDLITVPDVGHGPMIEAPDRFADILWRHALRSIPA